MSSGRQTCPTYGAAGTGGATSSTWLTRSQGGGLDMHLTQRLQRGCCPVSHKCHIVIKTRCTRPDHTSWQRVTVQEQGIHRINEGAWHHLEFIFANTPEQNGHIESFHKTLKKEYLWPLDFPELPGGRDCNRKGVCRLQPVQNTLCTGIQDALWIPQGMGDDK